MYKTAVLKKLAENLGFTYSKNPTPREIILNFSDGENKHGCIRKCPYCNWKDNPLAQYTLYPNIESIEKYLQGFNNDIVTLCGGGDPLYRLDKNYDKVCSLIDYLQNRGHIIRIITREQDNFNTLHKIFPNILGSFSIDSFDELKVDDSQIEYSIVLNRILFKEIIETHGECLKRYRILLREPMGTSDNFKRYEFSQIKYFKNVEIVTSTINNNEYLVGNTILHGYEIFR